MPATTTRKMPEAFCERELSAGIALSLCRTDRLTVTCKQLHKQIHTETGARTLGTSGGCRAAARRGGPVGTGNHDSSSFRSFCSKPKPKASLPNSTRTSHSITGNPWRQLIVPENPEPEFPCLIKGSNCSRVLCALSVLLCPRPQGKRQGEGWQWGLVLGGQQEKTWPNLGPLLPIYGIVLPVLQFLNASWALKCQTFQLSSQKNRMSASIEFFKGSQGK